MDKFKETTMKEYTASDVLCPFVCIRHKTRVKLKKTFKKSARRKLKQELRKELDNG